MSADVNTTSMQEQPGDAMPARDPVIIGGVPRTGVRLLASILDAHPTLASGPELPFVMTMAHQWRVINANLGVNHARHYGVSPDATRASFRASMLRLLAPRLQHAGKQRFVYHSFAVTFSLDVFAALFPAAHFILMVRDPRDVARSLLECNWSNPRDGLPLPYTRDVGAAAKLWVDYMGVAQRFTPALEATRRLILLRYEDLCARPRETMARLGEFLREPAPQPLIQAGSANLITTSLDDPHPALRGGAIDATRVGLWRRGLSAADIFRIEQITAPLLRSLGYR